MKRLTLFALLLCVGLLPLAAQQARLFTSKDRLFNSLINQIMQDSRGYIWIATEDGLTRFDGVEFSVYRSGEGQNGLKNNYVRTVFEDSRNRMWVGCIDGLQLYDRATDTFADVPLIAGADTVVAHVTGLAEDRDGTIWISTSGRGLMRFDGRCARAADTFVGISAIDFISSILIDRQGYLWVVAFRNGVYKCNIGRAEVSAVSIGSGRFLSENAFVAEYGGEVFLSVDNDGIYRYDKTQNTFGKCDLGTADDQLVVSALCAVGQTLYVGTDGNGLIAYDMQTGTAEAVNIFDPQIDFGKAKIHSIITDRDNNMWLALFQKGIMLVPHSVSHIVNYGYHPNNLYNIGSGSVMSILCGKGGLWVGTDSDGLYFVDSDGHSQHMADGLPKTIMGMEHCADGDIWLAGYNEGLVRLDPSTGRATDCNAPLAKALKRFNKRTTCLAYDNKNRLWVGTFGCGAFVLDKGQATSYVSTSETITYSRDEPVNNWVNAFCPDGSDIWLGTYRGVSCYSTRLECFVEIADALYNVIGQSVVSDIAAAPDGSLWFATNNGVVQYDKATGMVTRFDKQHNDLASNMAVGIVVDADSDVWVSTFRGLSRLRRGQSVFENHYAHNGLSSDEYSRNAVARDADGTLYFGSLNGVTSFDPRNMRPAQTRQNVEIIGFYLNGNKVRTGDLSGDEPVITSAVLDADTFAFSYAEKSFTFELSTFNFLNPEQVRYEYRLEGFDTRWHTTNYGVSQITFTNLSPDTYNLEIRSTMGNSVSATKRVTIVIAPLWWQTSWAWLLYAFIILIIAAMIYMAARSRNKIKAELLRREHERSIDEARFRFFFNISHEIRTPLTLIINPVKELMARADTPPEVMGNYNLIMRNSTRILRLINQLLDIRKADMGEMKMRFANVGLPGFVEGILHSFDYLAKKKNLSITFRNEMSDPQAAIDPNQFDKVINNLYSNAFKFTTDGGTIETIVADAAGGQVSITITDSGPGVPADQRERIFDRFYQVDTPQTAAHVGTGIGLHLSNVIVALHGGTISVDDCPTHKGARFTVTIPKTQIGALPDTPPAEGDGQAAEPEHFDGHAAPAVEASDRQRSTTNKRILVVDDEPEVQSYLVDKLSKRYKVTACSNGKEAYSLLLKEPFDMVISDVLMPEMDGMTLCRKIKSNVNINHVPVVLLTAKHSDEDRNEGLLTGADAYIAKPFDMQMLRNTISSIIANRERIMGRMKTGTVETVKRVEVKSSDEALMERVTDFIDKNISDPTLNVEKLAAHVGMSRVHMHRKLKELTNQSAREFIKNIRLKQAGILLGEKKINISDVAYALGYTSLSHFSSSFKDFYGVSPKEYMTDHISQDKDDEEQE